MAPKLVVKGIKDNGERDLGKCASLLAAAVCSLLFYCRFKFTRNLSLKDFSHTSYFEYILPFFQH